MAVLGRSTVLYNYVFGAAALLPQFPTHSCTLPNSDRKHAVSRGGGGQKGPFHVGQ